MGTNSIKIIKFNSITANNWNDYVSCQNKNNTNIIINFSIEINPNNYNQFENALEFKNCIFNFDIKIENVDNTELEIKFINCKFKGNLDINRNNLKRVQITWYTDDSSSKEEYSNINSKFEKNFSISSNKFELNCKIQKLNQTQGNFTFIGNVFLKMPREIYPDIKTDYTICEISNCKIQNGSFNGNTFYLPFVFISNYLQYNSAYEGHTFKGNKFQKAFFSKTDFGRIAQFFDCDFCGTTLFDEIKNIKNTNLHFRSCKFSGFTHFGLSEIKSIVFEYILFERNVSFKNSNFNFIKFEETKFEKGAFFDDLNKNNSKVINDWDRTTIREIKRELANSHNQIDYLRFKAYELKAYKKEVNQNKLSWKDSLILYFNEDSNYFGLDWTKGIQFIIKWSFLFYLLYLISYIYVIKCFYLKPSQADFYINYIKFTNPLSFLNPPLKNSENYFFPLLFLSLGKIFVSYGIYQTIQAFRKFGVTGG